MTSLRLELVEDRDEQEVRPRAGSHGTPLCSNAEAAEISSETGDLEKRDFEKKLFSLITTSFKLEKAVKYRHRMMEMMRNGKAWTVNGVAATGHVMDPILTLARNRSYILALDNQTAWYHPIHLHGHSFRVISRNGEPTRHKEWQDTVMMAPREQVEIAFVADNPGGWMFHCHILEHQAGGMMGVIQVT